MTFTEFKKQYDRTGSVILLEGKREVLPEDKDSLTRLGEKLCKELKHSRFRSGNADGADHLFCKGVANIDRDRLELILPYTSHKKRSRLSDNCYSLEDLDMLVETNIVYHSKSNQRVNPLIDKYVQGDRGNLGMKGSYLLRDTLKVTGSVSGIKSASFAIFYDDLKDPETGGTGHTMKMCKLNGIPYINQNIWFDWIE